MMAPRTLAELKGNVDYGIITIIQDEYTAVLKRFPGVNNSGGERDYRISDVFCEPRKIIRVAVVRASRAGLVEAQSVANHLINDLNPKCLLAVGIAGGIPEYDLSLGDVVAATHIHDFSMEAVKDEDREFNLGGGPVPLELQNRLVSLASYEAQLGDWAHDASTPPNLPPVDYENEENYYGPDDWKKKVRESLERHYGSAQANRRLKVLDGPVASSDRLIKNVEFTQNLLRSIRKTRAVEMEVAGVYQACRRAKGKDYLVSTFRGISDLVGFKRDDRWTEYACHSAAAFTYAFVKSGILIPPQSVYAKGGLASGASLGEEDLREMLRQAMDGIKQLVDDTKRLLKGKVTVADCDDAVQTLVGLETEFLSIPKILTGGKEIPKSLRRFHDTFLVTLGNPKKRNIQGLTQGIRDLRSVLGKEAAQAKRSQILEGLNELTRKINEASGHLPETTA